MIKTPVYELNQPQGNDTVDIELLNENARKIDNILNLKIDNSKKSDSISSSSSETIATSKAVKSAYDKGMEALDKASRNDTQLEQMAKKTDLDTINLNIDNLAGLGRTTQTIKNNADAIAVTSTNVNNITNSVNTIVSQLNNMRFFVTTNSSTPVAGTTINNDVWFDMYTSTIKLRLANSNTWSPFGYTYQ